MCVCVCLLNTSAWLAEWLYLTLSGVNGDKDKDMKPDMLSKGRGKSASEGEEVEGGCCLPLVDTTSIDGHCH